MSDSDRPEFDGETYSPELDRDRLLTQLSRVRSALADGQWHTIPELRERAGGMESAVSARIRDLRKDKHGGFRVESRRVAGQRGLWEYRLVVQPQEMKSEVSDETRTA